MRAFPTQVSSQWLAQQIKAIDQQLDRLLDQIVFEPALEAAATDLMRARLHLLHALTRSGLPPLLKTTEATEIPNACL
jgi:hypothetical protein